MNVRTIFGKGRNGWLMVTILMVLLLASSCQKELPDSLKNVEVNQGDNTSDNPSQQETFSDYYFLFEVVDRGTLGDADANALMGQLNSTTGTMTAYTKAEAVYVFDSVVESLRTNYTGYNGFELSFRVKLMTKTTTVKSKVIHIKTMDCTVD